MAGVAAYMSLRPRDRRDLERMLPALLRGTAVLTRLLRSNRHPGRPSGWSRGSSTARPAPCCAAGAAGRPISPLQVGTGAGVGHHRVLGRGPARRGVVRRHARGLAHARRRNRAYGGRGVRRAALRPLPAIRLDGPAATRQQPDTRGPPAREPAPARVRPDRDAGPGAVPQRPSGRTVRVVSDVRVPRGAVPAAGRPVSSPRRARTR